MALRSWTDVLPEVGAPICALGPPVPEVGGHVMVLGVMGGADCEAIGDGWLAQPVAAWTTVAYIVAGAWLARCARRRDAQPRLMIVTLAGLALVAVGVGSFAYHGPQPGWAQAAHDQSITGFVAVLLAAAAWRLRSRPRAMGMLFAATGAAASIVVLAGRADAVPFVLGTAAVVATLVERSGVWRAEVVRRWAGPAGVFALAALAHAAGRTSSPLCRPGSWAQSHALWHVLSAVALAWMAKGIIVARGGAGPTLVVSDRAA